MTDRVNAITIVLDNNYRTDDVKAIVNAILMVKGVRHVELNVADMNSHIAYTQARMDIENSLFKSLSEKRP